MRSARTILAVFGLAATSFVAVPTAAVATSAPVVSQVASSIEPKPFSAGTIEIDTAALTGGDVAVETDPIPGLGNPTVVVSSTGEAEISGTDLSVDGPAGPTGPVAAALADATGSTVVATLHGDDGGVARTATDTVWVDDFRGHTLVSELGEQDLRLQRVDVLEDLGTVDTAQADDLRERILGGGAATTDRANPRAACPANRVCLSGTVRWTDSAGTTHPVTSAQVQIREREAATDQVVTTVTTNGTGRFAATFNNNDGDGTRRDIYLRVRANGPGFTMTQFIDSTVTNNIRLGARAKNLTANNVNDNNVAFSVRAALVRGSTVVKAVNGSLFPAVPVTFPSDGSYYDPVSVRLHLQRLDRWDWDVVLHELGHYVAIQADIEFSPGGPHGVNDNLSVTRGSKDIGTKVAWAEGWASFFAVSALDPVGGIPLVGDARYQDTEDVAVDLSLEDPATLGEDNERTVSNILWDLYDTVVDGHDNVSMTTNSIWDTLNSSDPQRLWHAYVGLSPGQGNEGVNCVFGDMNVAPAITNPASVGTSPPTFQWTPGNGATFKNNSFTVAFRSTSSSNPLFTSAATSALSFTPQQADWNDVRAGAGSILLVTVTGTQFSSPPTGPYRSCTTSYSL